jgi:hypothetical protein
VIRGRYSRAIAAKYHQTPRVLPPLRTRLVLGCKSAPISVPRGLNRQAAAEYIGVGTTLFDAMVRDGRMPAPFRVGARVIWDRRKLDDAFDALSDQDEDRNPWDALAA